MSNDQKTLMLEALKIVSDDYRYRDQMMVTEFGLAMTAVGLAGSVAIQVSNEFAKVGIVAAIVFFLLVVGNHMARINQDREHAGQAKTKLLRQLGMEEFIVHTGFAQTNEAAVEPVRRHGIPGLPGPLFMLVSVWATMLLSAVILLNLIHDVIS
ncbi:MAG: hypothetical protein AAF197_09250 [Pseudomonadota bacterium]